MAKLSSAKYTILSYLFLVLSLVLSVSWSFRIFISLLIVAAIVFNKRASALFVIKDVALFSFMIFVMNALLYSDENPLFAFWVFNLTNEGIQKGLEIAFLIISISVLSSYLLSVLSDKELAQGISELIQPLKRFRLPVGDISMIMTLSLRFIPMLRREGEEILASNRIRSLNSNRGIGRFIPIILPIFLSSFRRVDTLSMAMEARGYKGDFTIEHSKGSAIDKIKLIGCFTLMIITFIRRYLYAA